MTTQNEIERFTKQLHIPIINLPLNMWCPETSPGFWKTPFIRQPYQLDAYLNHIDLIGAKILDVNVITHPDLYEPVSPTYWTIKVRAIFVLITDKGAFELCFPDSSTVFITRNSISYEHYCPQEILDEEELPPLFKMLKGETVLGVTIQKQSYYSAEWEYSGFLEEPLPENLPAYIKEFSLHLKNKRRLSFNSAFDWTEITLRDREGRIVRMMPKVQN